MGLRAPIEKLPLTTRKNVRDEFEQKKPDYEKQISHCLGKTWTIVVDANLIYSYADEDRRPRLGDVISEYIESFVGNLERFVEHFGEDGKNELNTSCSTYRLVFGPQDKTDFTYGGLVVENNELHLVFAEDCLAVNTDDVSKEIAEALRTAPLPGNGILNLVARNAIKQDYDPQTPQLQQALKKATGVDLKLDPNWESNAKLLAASSGRPEAWEKSIGWITLGYFESLRGFLERQGFEGDEMLQEAFQEAVTKGIACVRVLEKLDDDSHYNEVKIEDGILYLQTIPECWGSNTDDVALKLMDIM